MLKWLRFDYVPAEIVLTQDERREVRRVARELTKYRRRRQVSAQACVMVFTLAAGMMAIQWWIGPARWLVIAFAPCVMAVWNYNHRRIGRRATYEALRELGFPLCRSCGYDLRGLPTTNPFCPECGEIIIRRGRL